MSEHPARRVVGLVLLALAGLAIAVGLSVTANNLATQPIGLLGEPLRAGAKLAPPSTEAAPGPTGNQQSHGRSTTTQTATIPTQTATTPTRTTPSTGSAGSPSGRFDDQGGGDPDHDDD